MAAEGGTNRYSDMSPGLEQVVYAGDTLTMRDNDGNEFAVTGRESDEVIEFLKAFDEWFTAKEAHFSAGILDALFHTVRTKFNNLPLRLQRELPSFAKGGVLLRGHPHV